MYTGNLSTDNCGPGRVMAHRLGVWDLTGKPWKSRDLK